MEPEQELLTAEQFKALQQGNQTVFHKVYTAYYSLIRFVIAKCNLCESDIADLIQDTFLTLYNKAGQIQDHRKLKAWLVVTARNKALDRIRSLKVRKETAVDFIDELSDQDGQDDTSVDSLHYELQVELVAEVLKKLVDGDQDNSIIQFYIEGKSAREIAQMNGEPISTITNRLSRFRKKFRGEFLAHLESLDSL